MLKQLTNTLRGSWLFMLEAPWRHSGTDEYRILHWIYWLVGWAWTIAGLVLGAFVAPSLAQRVGLAHTQYEGTFEIAVSVGAGFVVQFAGWFVFIVVNIPFDIPRQQRLRRLVVLVYIVLVLISLFLPFAAVGYALYRLFAFVGPGQKLVTTAAIGGFLVKAFLIPLIKGIVTGAALKTFTDWVRGDKPAKH